MAAFPPELLEEFDAAVLACQPSGAMPQIPPENFARLEELAPPEYLWDICRNRLEHAQDPRVQSHVLHRLTEAVKTDFLRKLVSPAEVKALNLSQPFLEWLAQTRHGDVRTHIVRACLKLLATLFKAAFPAESSAEFFGPFIACASDSAADLERFNYACTEFNDVMFAQDKKGAEDENRAAQVAREMSETGVIHRLFDMFYSVLTTEGITSEPAGDTIAVIALFAEWADPTLILNERMWPVLKAALANEDLQTDVCQVLHSLVVRNLPSAMKLSVAEGMINENIFELLGSDDEDVQSTIAPIVDEIMSTLSNVADPNCHHGPDDAPATPEEIARANELIERMVPIALQTLLHVNEQINEEGLDALSYYVTTLDETTLTQSQFDNVSNILDALRVKLQFPMKYNWKQSGDDEKDVDDMRERTFGVLEAIVDFSGKLTKEWVCACLEAATQQPDCPWPALEAPLAMFECLGETLAEDANQADGGMLPTLLNHIVHPTFSMHPHHLVRKACFTCLTKPVPLLGHHPPEVLEPMFAVLLDERGLSSEDPEMRNLAAEHLLFTVRSMDRGALAFYCERVLGCITPLLGVEDVDDTLGAEGDLQRALMEVTGVCVGRCAPLLRDSLAHQMLSRIADGMRELSNPDPSDPGSYFTTSLLRHQTRLLRRFSQGFECGVKEETAATAPFDNAMQLLVVANNVAPWPLIGEEVLMTLASLRKLTPQGVLATVPPIAQKLLEHHRAEEGEGENVQDACVETTLMAELFADQIKAGQVSPDLLGVVAGLLSSSMKYANFELSKDFEDLSVLRRQILRLISVALDRRYEFITGGEALATIASACVHILETASTDGMHQIKLQQRCFHVMAQVVSVSVAGYEEYVLQQMLGLCLAFPMQPRFDLDEKETRSWVLKEISLLLRSIFITLPDAAAHALSTGFLPQLGCDPDLIQQFLTTICGPVDVWDLFLLNFLTQAKAANK